MPTSTAVSIAKTFGAANRSRVGRIGAETSEALKARAVDAREARVESASFEMARAARRWRVGRAIGQMAKANPRFGQIVRRHFEGDFVAGQNLDAVLLHLARNICDDFDTVIQRDSVTRVGQDLGDYTLDFKQFFFGHERLERADIGSLLAFRAGRHIELDFLVFGQRLEAVALNRREMGEQIFTTTVGLDESETLCVVEPLYCTRCHVMSYE
jgi:hypothetical protein